jgi:hypothetical protein
MATPKQVVTGLGGAIGSSYVRQSNQVFFVEFNGKISVLDLVRPLAGVVSQGTVVLPATSVFVCDTGAVGAPGSAGDFRLEQTPRTQPQLRPVAGTQIVNLGPVDFGALTHAELQNLTYSTTPIPLSQLASGDVFAVLTSTGNYCKVKVGRRGTKVTIEWVTYKLGPRYRVLGTGFNQPEDIAVTAGGRYAYVTERIGNLQRVDLTNTNSRIAVSKAMTAPHQIALDEDRAVAYVVEYANPGRLLRIDLTNGTQTVVANNLENAIGLLVTKDKQYAYVSEQTPGPHMGTVSRITLSTGNHERLVEGLTNPFLMTWTDASESAILIPERDPANRISLIDLTRAPVEAVPVATGVPFRPSSVAVTAPNQVVICCDKEIDLLDLASGAFTSAGPLFMGIGHVPNDHIIDGYADTTQNPVTHQPESYFLSVKDAPFGGTLALMVNHELARKLGAQFYRIYVDGSPQAQGWSDYKWDSGLDTFVLKAAGQVNDFFRVRGAGEIWYNYWLGYFLDTTALPDGLHKISVEAFGANASGNPGASKGSDTVIVCIDNQWPRAVIERIIYWDDPDNPNPALRSHEVATCEIVQGKSDEFTFFIEAVDPQGQHLLGWSLVALWGDNKSAGIDSEGYDPTHVSPNRQWLGVHGEVPVAHWHATVPSDVAAGDLSSRRCAHTFYLAVWDRVINGWGYIHSASYHKSITLLLS